MTSLLLLITLGLLLRAILQSRRITEGQFAYWAVFGIAVGTFLIGRWM